MTNAEKTGNDINREKIHELVSVFYRPTFKTFYINSQDGESICKPTGVFVSLGITTSMGVLKTIRDIIGSNKEYEAKLVEIGSRKFNDNTFVNNVVSENPEQYFLKDADGVTLFNREEALEELGKLKEQMNPDTDLEILKERAPKVSRLKYLIDKLDETEGWKAHKIQKEDGEMSGYRIYHMYVNYEKRDNVEYRIGIFVNEKQQDNID